jgi:phosphatidate phosphatase APP1
VGDSAQEDPEIYADLVATHGKRILAVYIRNVRPHPERARSIRELARRVETAGSTLVLADDTLTIARHAVAHGWVSGDALGDVGEEKQADEPGGAKQPAPGIEQQPAPTLVVDQDVRRRELE